MTPEQLAVADANETFYRALSGADLEGMSALWFPADWAECVHPGSMVLRGWDAIRESWQQIFASGAQIAVSLTDVRVRLLGDVAWASCLERIATAEGGEIHSALAHAVNMFVRHDGRWRLVLHHASPVPFVSPQGPRAESAVN